MKTKRQHGWVVFNPDEPEKRYQMPDPLDERTDEIIHALRYFPASVTAQDMMRIASVCETYRMLATYELQGAAISKLRDLRKYVRAHDGEGGR